MTRGKTISLTRRTLVSKVLSLLLNMLSRLVITFLPRIKHLLISWLHSYWRFNECIKKWINAWKNERTRQSNKSITDYENSGLENPLQASCYPVTQDKSHHLMLTMAGHWPWRSGYTSHIAPGTTCCSRHESSSTVSRCKMFFTLPKQPLQMVTAAMKLKDA